MQAPPQSPIPDGLFKFAMHVGALGAIARVAFSLYQQAQAAKAPATELLTRLSTLSAPADKEEIENTLLDVLAMLETEESTKRGSAKNVLRAHMQMFIDRTLRGVKESSVLLRSLKVVAQCASDPMCKREFVRCGGIRVLVHQLQAAHEASNISLMEEIAATLREVTFLTIDSMAHPMDEPAEAQGALALLKISSLCSMLRTLDPNARNGFLASMVTIFSSVCALYDGAQTIGKGLDGKKGIEFFVPLLDHSHAPVVAASMRLIHSLAEHNMRACRDELEKGSLLGKLVDNIDIRREGAIVFPALRIVGTLLSEKEALRAFILRDGLDCLFTMWCNGNDPHLRGMAEDCIGAIEQNETWAGTVQKSREVYRSLIQRRAEADEKEKKQQMQAMQQQQMFQRMMMEQLGISPEMVEGQE